MNSPTTVPPAQATGHADLASRIQYLCDKQELHDLVAKYCRGADRFDAELMLECFHPGAVDDHGPTGDFTSAEQLVENAMSKRDQLSAVPSQHVMSNVLFDIEGDRAFGEIYIEIRIGGPNGGTGAFGRYIDRYERREGRWGITHRITNIEWAGKIPWPDPRPGARDRTDWVYDRSLPTQTVAHDNT